MRMTVRRGRRVDRHAADRIKRFCITGRGGRIMVMVRMAGVVVVRMIRHGVAGLLVTYTLGGYIDPMQTDAKTSVLKRLQRIEGQVRGLSRMVEEDRYCIDVVTQLSAVRAAVRAVEDEVMRDHAAHC